MNESILDTIKLMLGVEPTYSAFDAEIIANINSVLMDLGEMGVIKDGFRITGESETWDDILEDRTNLEGIKVFIQLKVKLLFDPPASQTVVESYRNRIQELEWRLYSKTGFNT